jgi:hypothetical protein
MDSIAAAARYAQIRSEIAACRAARAAETDPVRADGWLTQIDNLTRDLRSCAVYLPATLPARPSLAKTRLILDSEREADRAADRAQEVA